METIVSFVDTVILAGRIFFGLVTLLGLVAFVGLLGFFIDVGE